MLAKLLVSALLWLILTPGAFSSGRGSAIRAVRRLARAVFLSAFLSFLALAASAPAVEIKIDCDQKFQTIRGLGAMLYPYSAPYTEPGFADLLVRDFGASVVRMEIIPTAQPDEPDNLETYLADPLDQIAASLKMNGTDNSKAGEVIKRLYDKRLDDLKLIATVWSPPKWMKTNADTRKGGKLRADRRKHFAKYLAAYCQEFEKAYGRPIYSLSIQNELMFEEPYNSCLYNPDTPEWAETMAEVGRTFKRYGLKTTLFGPENMGLAGWFFDNNRKFAAQLAREADGFNALQAWAFHGYQADGKTQSSSLKNWAAYHDELRTTGKELWMTETSGNDPAWIHRSKEGSPDGALDMGVALHDALVAGNITLWTYWSFQDGDRVSAYNLTARGDKNSKKYNAAKHFIRYVRPGAVRVQASPDEVNLPVAAFLHPGQKTATVIFVNSSEKEQEATLTLSFAPNISQFQVYLTTANTNCAAGPSALVSGERTRVLIPAQSIVTLYGLADGASGPKPL